MEKLFETALRKKFRFNFKGVITVEDLWDLSIESLDVIYKQLNALAKQSSEESLLNKKTDEDKLIDMKIEIIKHIVSVKQEEAAARLKAVENRVKKQKLISVLKAKEEDELQNKSVEEIQKMLDELEE